MISAGKVSRFGGGRFPEDVLKRWAGSMTSHAAAGQLNSVRRRAKAGFQSATGSLIRLNIVPDGLHLVRSWDLASAFPTPRQIQTIVSVYLWALDPRTQLLYLLDVIRGRWSPAEVENKIKATARWDGEETRIEQSHRIPDKPGNSRPPISLVNCGAIPSAPSAKRATRNGAPIPLPRSASTGSSSWSRVIGTSPLSTSSAPSQTAPMTTRWTLPRPRFVPSCAA